ncbi:MAG TPA: ArsR family transcriptional regulator [Candidatus Marinimicrobia bacterium]|nr:ArsR family transcriptional regulator [Candidatus Neomarinimicrobiota bacterium]
MSKNLSVQFLQSASSVMKALGHPARIKIVEFLQSDEKSVSEIQEHIGRIQPVTSQHLSIMRDRGIVISRRKGTTIYYSIANDFISKVLDCIAECQAKIQSGEWQFEFGELSKSEDKL